MVSPQSVDLSRIRPQDVAVVIAFLAAVFIFRAPDVYELKPVWRLDIDQTTGSQHTNILPLPIIEDLDSDGINELVVATQDGRIKVMTFPTKDYGGDLLPHLHLKVETSIRLNNGTSTHPSIPVAMTTGCLQNRARNNECYKTIIVVTSDGSVLAYDHFLNRKWNTTVNTSKKIQLMHFKEIAVLVLPQGQDGLVVVGRRTTDNKHDKQTLGHEHDIDAAPKETVEELARKPNTHSAMDPNKVSSESEHFSTFAFNGRVGRTVWSHKPGDFEANVTAREHLFSSYHFKLALQPNQYHTGEEHWTKYLRSFLNTLPYRWHHPSDTKLFTAHFIKGSRKTKTKSTKQSWFDIKAPNIELFSSGEESDKNVQHNSIVIHNQHGVEVLRLDSGRPVCRYAISKEAVSLGDVNEDGHVDHVTTHFESRDDSPNSVPSCSAVVSSQSRTLFTGSICQTQSLFSGMFDGSRDVKHGEEPLPVPPVIVHSPPHRSGVFRHLMGHNLRRSRVGFDSVFLVSTGKITSFGPHGELNWQVKVDGSWKDHVRADEPSMTPPNARSFFPSMKPVAIDTDQNQNALFITSWHHISLVSLIDGTLLASHTLPCQPVSPVVEGDFTNDGLTDFVVQCSDSYLGFALDRHIGYMWTIIWVVSGMMVVAIALGLLRIFEEELL